MLKSIWRYSHLMLAVSSFLILSLLSITGIILAADPIIEQQKGFKIKDKDAVPLATLIPLLKEKYPSIGTVTVTEYGMVTMQYTDDKDEDKTVFIDPHNASIVGTPTPQTPLMEWMTNLHRSLFLKETGRAIVGITAALLILITLSGVLLLIQRQRGIKRFFAPAGGKGSAAYYHVIWGRVSLFLIIFIAFTGGYLSYERFFPDTTTAPLTVDVDNMAEEPLVALDSFSAWKHIALDQVTKIQYPFSEFPEDYYLLHLKDKHIAVNQFTGAIIGSEHISKQKQWQAWAVDWHTGRNSILWAIILGIGSGYVLFFIISGFLITFKRIKKTASNKYKIDEASHIILIGTENGSTKTFAASVYQQMLRQGIKAHITTLNEWTTFQKATEITILTATYGDGEAPHSANRALELIKNTPQSKDIKYTIVGFGSRQYPNFCGFAYEVESILRQVGWAHSLLKLHTVDDKSPSDFEVWIHAYNNATNLSLLLDERFRKTPKRKNWNFEVIEKSEIDENETFILKLKTNHKKIQSGDLLAIFPVNDYQERLYSIGMIDNVVQLFIKQQHGLGTTYLSQLKMGDRFKAHIIQNEHFHLPATTPVMMICNGTGIAPFLGMIADGKQQKISLYCGFRTQKAFDRYQPFLDQQINAGKLEQYNLALSRATTKTYVSDLLLQDANKIATLLKDNGTIMICGSLTMMRDVLQLVKQICDSHQLDYESFQQNGQILTDCY